MMLIGLKYIYSPLDLNLNKIRKILKNGYEVKPIFKIYEI